MTTLQLSKKTGLHVKTLARYARQNVIPGVRIGGPVGWIFNSGEVLAALRISKGNKAQRILSKQKEAA